MIAAINVAAECANTIEGGTHTSAHSSFSYPDPHTVKGKVLANLLSGERITHKDVWLRHGSSRAAHHVYILRGLGWPVRSIEIDATTRDGRMVRIAEYSLPKETIHAAGERGQIFSAKALRGSSHVCNT
jgi:hypothetical protein